ncbi:ubiquitin thioesterase OTUB1 [Lingula anatina]|uniref:ubiquitinyl hydrolase 1 n=1 Tax=Lingula anatina TaxID=7574 RepID=A0A1S3ITC5_LINAN|nr:ubiquitin thioesterase OTUB1 [Lingula anatina]|eukprot:XP_013401338.1 ubiquitin thioesterase OTUB1 [Lingula anatina]
MAEEGTLHYDPDKNYDEETLAQQRIIEKQIAGTQDFVTERLDFSVLEQEYAEDPVYIKKVRSLKSKYLCLRKTRGDGNCFYRAFGFAYFEKLLEDQEEFNRFRDVASKSKDVLVSLGFPQFTIEDFHDTFMEVVDKVGSQCPLEELHKIFNDQGYSDYLVVYLRLLVSGHLQKEADFFSNFVEGDRTIKEFCNQEVEPMGKESDHIHIIALTAVTGVSVRVEYMDRGGETTNAHDFPDGSTPKIALLYRPGHYDILYT